MTDTLALPHATSCTACLPGMWTAVSTTACQSCDASVNPNAGTRNAQTECRDCSAGAYSFTVANGKQCNVCSAGSITDMLSQEGATQCTACSAGLWSPIASTDCVDCLPGSVTSTLTGAGASSCNVCPAGQFSTDATLACTQCAAGKYVDVAGSDQASDCIDCVVGKYVDVTGSDQATDCIDCIAGTYNDVTGSASASYCISCDPGRFGAGGSTTNQCSGDCDAGKYSLGDTAAGPAGNDCISCDAGKWQSAAGSDQETDCIDCIAGKYVTTVGSIIVTDCIGCLAGKYSTTVGSAIFTDCIDCIAGKYIVAAASDQETDCIDCIAGKYSTMVGSAVVADCIGCTAGKYVVATASDQEADCIDCVAGKYSTMVGSVIVTDCIDCSSGKYGAAAASDRETDCIDCAAGKYATNTGQAADCLSCLVAGAGTAPIAPNATGPTTCDPCVPGEFSIPVQPDNAGFGQICAVCDPGSVTNTLASPGGSTCIPCLPSTYSDQATIGCQSCAAGSVTDTLGRPGAINCTSCDVGWMNGFSTEACYRVMCAPGKWCDTVGVPHDCPGTGTERFSAPNQGVCDMCFEGWYQGSAGTAECLQCIPGQFSQDAATVCELCTPGLWGDPSQWVAGDPDTSYSCEPCVAGALTNTGVQGGAWACTACTPGQFSANPTDEPSPDTQTPPTWAAYNVPQTPDTVNCEVCPVGWATNTLALPGSSNCTTCTVGTDNKLPQAGGLHNPINPCIVCLAGQFTVFMPNNGTNCTLCPLGSETDTAALPGGTTCTVCARGRYSPFASQECRNCPGGWYQPEPSQPTCFECRAECLPSGSPTIQYWDFGSAHICGITNKALAGASAANDFEYVSGMSVLGMFKDAPGDLDIGPFSGGQTGATICARCETGFALEFLTDQGANVMDGVDLPDSVSPHIECPAALVNLTQRNVTARSACDNAVGGNDVCTYTPTRRHVTELCVASARGSCSATDMRNKSDTEAAIACQRTWSSTPGVVCYFSSTTDANGARTVDCLAIDESTCAAAPSGSRECTTAGLCTYTAPVSARNESCVANNASSWLIDRRLSAMQNASGYKCTQCPPGQYSVPNSAECAFSCPPATYTINEVVDTTGDPSANQYPLGLKFDEVGACVPCGHVEADTNDFTLLLDEDENEIGQLEKARFYETPAKIEEEKTGVYEQCCVSPTENGFAQTARGCIECPMMDRCVAGQCAMNSAGEACSMCQGGYFGVGARCVECPQDTLSEVTTYAFMVGGTAALLVVLWHVTQVKGGDEKGDGANADGQDKLEGSMGNTETFEEMDDSGRALSNTAIFSGSRPTHNLPSLLISRSF